MFIALWIIAPIFLYLFIAGTLRKPFAQVAAGRCSKCFDGKHHWRDDSGYRSIDREQDSAKYHGEDGSIRSALWPFTLPWTIGTMVTGTDRAQSKKVKAGARRAEELAEAEHQVELAKLRKKENELLDHHLKLVEIERQVRDN